jgi:uncharacterized protein YgiM (DUF1202 family)
LFRESRIIPILFAILTAIAIVVASLIYSHNSIFAAPAFAEESQSDSNAGSGESQPVYFKIADTGANLRSGHSTGSDVIASLMPGEVVLEIKAHSGWMYVEVISTTTRGWVWDDLLIADPDHPAVTPAEDTSHETGNSTDEAESESKTDDTSGSVSTENSDEKNLDPSDGQTDDNDKDNESTESTDVQSQAIPITGGTEPVPAQGGDAIDLKKPAGGGNSGDDKEDEGLSGASSSAVAGSDLIALITAESVNLRAEPNLRSKVLAQVDTGLKVYIIDEKKPWYYVSVPKLNLKGWVFGDFVQPLDYVVITGDDVNMREKPDMNSKVIMKLAKGMRFVKKAWQNDFILVANPDKGYTGWVHQRYTKVEERKALPVFLVKGYSVNFRKEPSVVSDVYSQLDTGTKVTVLGREAKWSFVKVGGQNGWIYSEFLVSEEDWNKIGGMRGVTRNLGADLISRALELRGTPYVWSGESIKGFDCSGFIYYLIGSSTGAENLPRSAADMFEQLGVPVDKEDLEPGDLVFFTTYKAGASHVGLYLGDGDFVHASSAQAEVTISNMSEGYYKEHFIGAKRVPKDLFE